MLARILEPKILKELSKREVIIINGPRRIGKTTLLLHLKDKIRNRQSAYFDFTDPAVAELWRDFSLEKIRSILAEINIKANKGIVFFDEIQYFPQVGLLFKLFYDYLPNVKIIASGSSSFLMLQEIGDSLAGRKKIYPLYPLSLSEIEGIDIDNYWQFKDHYIKKAKWQNLIRNFLVTGSYPEIILGESLKDKQEKLKEIVDSYLFKDLLMIEHIKKPRVIVDLVRLLAFQIGSLVNPNELSQTLGISRETVLNYIDLLEKFFIVFKIYPYQQNLRDVIKKKFKVYFYDLGVRNALISDYSMVGQRLDKGFLLENLVVAGIKRRLDYEKITGEMFFWRDYDGKEVDLLLKTEEMMGIEVKWERKKTRFTKGFLRRLPEAKLRIVGIDDAYKYCL